MNTVPVTCNKDCGGGCPLLAHNDNRKIVKITDNPAGTPYMTGCPRGYMGHLALYAPDRITAPLIRSGPRGSGSFREASWEEAIEQTAAHLVQSMEEQRTEGIFRLGGSGACESVLHNTNSLAKRFLSLVGPYTDRTGSYSSGAELFTMPFMFGSEPYGLDPSTLLESRFIILWGMNPADTIFGCELRAYLAEAKKRNIPITVIDPRRSATVKRYATQWIPILPGTDSALMSAVLYILITENLIDRSFLDIYTHGFDKIEAYILQEHPKTPEWAEKVCGVSAETIRNLALQYGKTHPTALLPGLSIQRTLGGEEAMRMGVVLQAAAGNIGVPGGSSGSNIWGRLPKPKCGKISDYPVYPFSEGDRPLVPEHLWAEAVLRGRAGGFAADIHGIYSVGGNFINQGADIKKNIAAFKKVDWVVCHEAFMTPTARWADIILPPTLPLEREDIVLPAGNYLLFSRAASAPPAGVKDDWEIFRLIAAALDRVIGEGTEKIDRERDGKKGDRGLKGGLKAGRKMYRSFEEAFTEGKTPEEWLKTFLKKSEIKEVEDFRCRGIYIAPEQKRVGLSKFKEDPENYQLDTPSGKIELSSADYGKTGFPEEPRCRWMNTTPDYPLRLITPHARLRINSQNSNISWFAEREEHRIVMNPADAAYRKLAEGDTAEITSPAGSAIGSIGVTEDIMPGVVSICQGAWFAEAPAPSGTRGGPVSANLLTSPEPTLPSNSSRTHSTAVEVRALES